MRKEETEEGGKMGREGEGGEWRQKGTEGGGKMGREEYKEMVLSEADHEHSGLIARQYPGLAGRF